MTTVASPSTIRPRYVNGSGGGPRLIGAARRCGGAGSTGGAQGRAWNGSAVGPVGGRGRSVSSSNRGGDPSVFEPGRVCGLTSGSAATCAPARCIARTLAAQATRHRIERGVRMACGAFSIGGRRTVRHAAAERPGRSSALPPLLPFERMKADLPKLAALEDEGAIFDDLNPAPRLLMGPGPINADPRVLRALASPLLGQFDPQFRVYMKETMELYRRVFETKNRWTLVVDGTARAAIECVMVSAVEPGEKVLVLSFGRFGQLITEIARRGGADVQVLETEWGTVFRPEQVEEALKRFSPKLVAVCQ